MGEMVLILFLIGPVVWILFSLFRGADVDRFLEEINEQRQQAGAGARSSPSSEKPVT